MRLHRIHDRCNSYLVCSLKTVWLTERQTVVGQRILISTTPTGTSLGTSGFTLLCTQFFFSCAPLAMRWASLLCYWTKNQQLRTGSWLWLLFLIFVFCKYVATYHSRSSVHFALSIVAGHSSYTMCPKRRSIWARDRTWKTTKSS